ncbi:hypothetical protein ACFQ4K_28295 [Tistrella bauzanensis]
MITLAREKGFAACIGDGTNRWPAVHRADAARLYRLAVESAPPGAVLHAVAEEGITLRDIATTIATPSTCRSATSTPPTPRPISAG